MPTMHIAQHRRGQDDEALCGAKVNDNLVFNRADVTCWRCACLVLGRPVPTEPPVPEHDRLKAVKHEGRDQTQLIGEFLDWLGSEEAGNIVLAVEVMDGLAPRCGRKEELIANFFGINENALEAEKRALLDYQRALNKATEWFEKEGRLFLRDNP